MSARSVRFASTRSFRKICGSVGESAVRIFDEFHSNQKAEIHLEGRFIWHNHDIHILFVFFVCDHLQMFIDNQQDISSSDRSTLVLSVSVLSCPTANVTLPIEWSESERCRSSSFSSALVVQAIQTYEYAIRCQSDWKNLHHVRRKISALVLPNSTFV